MKKCPKCGKSKEIDSFYANKNRFDKKSGLCKECDKSASKIYDHTPKGKYSQYKRSAKSRGFIFTITLDEFIDLWNKNCFYCGEKIKEIGLDRLNSNIGYEIGNVVPCCIRCNMMKTNLSYNSFIKHCNKIIELHKKII